MATSDGKPQGPLANVECGDKKFPQDAAHMARYIVQLSSESQFKYSVTSA